MTCVLQDFGAWHPPVAPLRGAWHLPGGAPFLPLFTGFRGRGTLCAGALPSRSVVAGAPVSLPFTARFDSLRAESKATGSACARIASGPWERVPVSGLFSVPQTMTLPRGGHVLGQALRAGKRDAERQALLAHCWRSGRAQTSNQGGLDLQWPLFKCWAARPPPPIKF